MIDTRKLPFHRVLLKPSLHIAASGFLYDRENGESYTVNAAGAVIFRSLQENSSVVRAWEEVARHFGISTKRAQWDTLRFLARLRELHLASFAMTLEPTHA